MIKVSILVPIYGVERYIEKCAVSLMEQTYPDIEYVFVNDCTKDKSVGILERILNSYPQRRSQVRVINHEQNKGLGAARRTALLNATGEFLLHVDSDDYIAFDAVEILVKKVQEAHVDIVDCAFAEVAKGKIVHSKLPFHGTTEAYNALILSRSGMVTNHIWGRLIKRSLYEENQILNEEGIDLGEDYSVLPKLLCDGKRCYVDNILYFYRTDNGTSYMNSCLSTKNIVSCIKAQQSVYDFLMKKNLSSLTKYSLELGMLNLVMFCRKNQYEYLKSNLYKTIPLDYVDLKVYGKMLKHSSLHYFNLLIKAFLTRKTLKKVERHG